MSNISPYVYPVLSVPPAKAISIDRIIEKTCSVAGINKTEFYGFQRTRKLAESRHIAIFLIRQLTALSYVKIAFCLNNRNHATMIHSYHTCINLYQTDFEFRHKANKVIDLLSLSPVMRQKIVDNLMRRV